MVVLSDYSFIDYKPCKEFSEMVVLGTQPLIISKMLEKLSKLLRSPVAVLNRSLL